MKICFDNVSWSSASGPNTFAQRLATQFSLDGHVIADADDYDVGLVFIEETGALKLKKPKVQRLDGIWFKNEHEFETKNVGIRSLYRIADSVVWQSDFDMRMTQKWWDRPRHGRIIRNGISTQKVEVTNATVHELRSKYEKIFVCSANWHKQKRLSSCINLFKHIRSTLHPYSCLVVMGSQPDCIVADKNIYYTDALPHELCLEIFSAADWMIHLAWADHCPNVVLEALSQKCPVICSSVGGTKEIVRENGIILADSLDYSFELFDYDSPPDIDVVQLTSLPHIDVDASAIDIRNVAKQYVDLFKTLV